MHIKAVQQFTYGLSQLTVGLSHPHLNEQTSFPSFWYPKKDNAPTRPHTQ